MRVERVISETFTVGVIFLAALGNRALAARLAALAVSG